MASETVNIVVNTSTGGNEAADAGKFVLFGASGQLRGSTESEEGIFGESSADGVGVRGTSIDGPGVAAQSINSAALEASSTEGAAIYAATTSDTNPVIHLNQDDATDASDIAWFHNRSDQGVTVKNNGSLDWTLPLAKKQTRVNMLPALGGNAAKVLAVNGAEGDVEWVAASGGGGGTWGSITGTLSDQTDLQAALDAKADKFPSVRAFTGTTDTLVIGDAGNTVNANCATACVITIPLNATVPFVARTRTEITWYGVGQPSIIPAGGATLNGGATAFKIAIRYGKCIIVREGTDEWTIDGNITT